MLLRKLKTDITLLKHVFIGTLFMLTLTCISCREGALSVTDEGYVPIEFSAHLRGDAPTRTHFTASDADLLISWEEDETVDVLHVNNTDPSLVARSATIGGTRQSDKIYNFRGNVRNLAQNAQSEYIEHYEYFYPGGTAYYDSEKKEQIIIDFSQQSQMGNGTRAHLKNYLPMHWSYENEINHEENIYDEDSVVIGTQTVIDRPEGYYPNVYASVVHVTFTAPAKVLSLEVNKAELFASSEALDLTNENVDISNCKQLGNNFDFAKRFTPENQRKGPITLNVHSYEGSNIWEFYFVVGPTEQIDHLYLRVTCSRALVIENSRVVEINNSYSYLRPLYDSSEVNPEEVTVKKLKAGKYYEFISNASTQ